LQNFPPQAGQDDQSQFLVFEHNRVAAVVGPVRISPDTHDAPGTLQLVGVAEPCRYPVGSCTRHAAVRGRSRTFSAGSPSSSRRYHCAPSTRSTSTTPSARPIRPASNHASAVRKAVGVYAKTPCNDTSLRMTVFRGRDVSSSCSPTSITDPPGATAARQLRRVVLVPAASNAIDTPPPSVRSRTALRKPSPSGITSAPSAAAIRHRSEFRSVTNTVVTPCARSTWMRNIPIGPTPMTRAVSAGPIPLRFTACTAHAAGSAMDAALISSDSGTVLSDTAETTRYSALLPESIAPSIFRLGHNSWCAARQNSHVPQEERGFAVTRSPTA